MKEDTPCKKINAGCEIAADFTSTPALGLNWAMAFNSTSTTNSFTTINSYSWTFGDGGSTSGTSPAAYHNYLYTGSFPVCLTTVGSSSLTKEECSTTTCKWITVGKGGGLDHSGKLKNRLDLGKGFDFTIAPNPVNTQTLISLHIGEEDELESVEILDAAGRILQTIENLDQFNGNTSISLKSNQLKSGIYFCRIVKNGYSSTKKFIK